MHGSTWSGSRVDTEENPRPRKTQTTRKDSFVDASPLLLRHLSTARAPLFSFLCPRDIVELLATCHAVRGDAETVDYALQTSPTAVRYVLRDCLSQWCSPTPYSDVDNEYNDWAYSDDYAESGDLYANQCPCATFNAHLERDHPHVPLLLDALAIAKTAYPNELASPASRASLLSLATLLATKLNEQLYEKSTPSVIVYITAPFILPLARLHELESIDSLPCRPTALGCHIENCWPREDGSGVADCTLCAGLVAVIDGFQAYSEQRGKEERDLNSQLNDLGIGSFSDEWEARHAAFKETKKETDELYGYRDFDYESTQEIAETLMRWGAIGRLSRLALIGDAAEADLEE